MVGLDLCWRVVMVRLDIMLSFDISVIVVIRERINIMLSCYKSGIGEVCVSLRGLGIGIVSWT